MASTLKTLKVGAVCIDNYGRIGLVTKIHDDGCPESASWCAGLDIPVSPAQIDGTWVSINVIHGGAVLVPKDRVEVLLGADWVDHLRKMGERRV